MIKPKKKRKGRRQLTNGVFGVPPELRPPWPAPVDPELEDVEEDAGDVDDVAELENRERAEGRTNGGEE